MTKGNLIDRKLRLSENLTSLVDSEGKIVRKLRFGDLEWLITTTSVGVWESLVFKGDIEHTKFEWEQILGKEPSEEQVKRGEAAELAMEQEEERFAAW